MNSLKNFIEDKMIRGKIGLNNFVNDFLSEERGDTNFVSIIIIIVIILAVAAIFRNALIQAVTTVTDKLLDFINS